MATLNARSPPQRADRAPANSPHIRRPTTPDDELIPKQDAVNPSEVGRVAVRGRDRAWSAPRPAMEPVIGAADSDASRDTYCTPRSSPDARYRGRCSHLPGTFVGLTRIELVTSSLSGMRSNRLSYSPRPVVQAIGTDRCPARDGRGGWFPRPAAHFPGRPRSSVAAPRTAASATSCARRPPLPGRSSGSRRRGR